MSQVLDFKDVARPKQVQPKQVQLRVVPRGDEMDDVWPMAIDRNLAEQEAIVDPANTPKRVLSEVFALFAVIALLILAVTLFVPGPSF